MNITYKRKYPKIRVFSLKGIFPKIIVSLLVSVRKPSHIKGLSYQQWPPTVILQLSVVGIGTLGTLKREDDSNG